MDSAASRFETAVYRKVSWRLISFLFVCYILAYLDRVNVGFGKLQMQQDIRLSDTAFGLGAGIFFIGYFLFEVPANMMLQRVGARRWLGPIMMAWGLISASTLFVRSAGSFLAMRFVLGAAESGFFPGVILYLTFWYPQKYRAKIVALFMSAIAVSGMLGGPVSGWILTSLSGGWGLRGWQWLYLLEGLPSVLAGAATLWFLENSPREARWLSPQEKSLILQRLDEEEAAKTGERRTLADVFRSGKVWALALVYFGVMMVSYGLSFWAPQILKDSVGNDLWRIGWLSAIPWAAGAAGMIVWGHHSDRTAERRWHFAVAATLAAVAFWCSALPGLPVPVRIAALALAAVGVLAAQSTFWAIPTAILSGTASAAGVAWINSVGNLGSFVSPYVVGIIRDRTHNMLLALLALAAGCLGSGIGALLVAKGERPVVKQGVINP